MPNVPMFHIFSNSLTHVSVRACTCLYVWELGNIYINKRQARATTSQSSNVPTSVPPRSRSVLGNITHNPQEIG